MSEPTIGKQVALAALLHDIGKFKQRAGFRDDPNKAHTQIGSEWLASKYGKGIISDAAKGHHKAGNQDRETKLDQIFYEADNCAASSGKAEFEPLPNLEKDWHREVQLTSVFSRVRNTHSDAESELPDASFRSLATADKWAGPLKKENRLTVEDYRKHWEAFKKEFKGIQELGNHYNVEIISHLLEKYTSSIPSISLKLYQDCDEATYREQPDVSLFDHLKITSAVAVCLLYYHTYIHRSGKDPGMDSDKPFMFIGGDISGVQKFIYTISSKGALKSLKGRSFFLELLMEHTVDRLMEAMDLYRPNVIFIGGGHFYLLAPNIPAAQHAIQSVRDEMNDYLFETFNADLQMLIQSIPFGKDGFNDSSLVWQGLSKELEKAKQGKWEDRLDQLLAEPQMPHEKCLADNCKVCGREDIAIEELSEKQPEVKACKHCRDQYLLGTWLQYSVRRGELPVIYRWDSQPDVDRYVQIGRYYYQLAAGALGSKKAGIAAKASGVFHLNDWDLGNFTHPFSRPILAGIYMSDLMELEDIAKKGFGMNRIGVLRMDVDYLGRLFSSGIPEAERSFSTMASLSRELSLFFKYHINGVFENRGQYPKPKPVIERQGKRIISIVYSGGDDLFLIGHWLDLTEAAFDIKNALATYTANPYISISGGLVLGSAHDPVYRLADDAGHAEESAKNNGRRSITLFDTHTFTWEESEAVKALTRNMLDFSVTKDDHLSLPEGSISRGALYRILALTREHKRKGGDEKVWVLPKLAYMFGRSRPKEKFAGPWGRLRDYVFSNNVNLEHHWHYLEAAILWNLMMMRKGGYNGTEY